METAIYRIPYNCLPPCRIPIIYVVFRRIRKIAKNGYSLRRVCLSVRTEHLGSDWTGFHEGVLKIVEKIQTWLKYETNNVSLH